MPSTNLFIALAIQQRPGGRRAILGHRNVVMPGAALEGRLVDQCCEDAARDFRDATMIVMRVINARGRAVARDGILAVRRGVIVDGRGSV